jgi:uncharacterized protein (UPF0332 family)
LTPEAGYFLAKAGRLLLDAEVMLEAKLYDSAGRTAYLAAFHAAQALITERTGRSVKTHRGVHAQLHRLIKDEQNIDAPLRAFLSYAYNLKSMADYETGPGSEVSAAVANSAVATGKRFVAAMAALIEI